MGRQPAESGEGDSGIRTDQSRTWRRRSKKAQESARALFTGGNAAEMPTSELTEADFVDGKIDILGVLVKSGLSASRSEARRAVEQGGVVVADEKVTDVKTTYAPEQFDGEGLVVRRGKKNFKRVVMK